VDVWAHHPVGLMAAETPADFAEKICTLLENPAQAEQMGAAARQTAQNDLNWKSLIVDLERFYYHILSQRSAA